MKHRSKPRVHHRHGNKRKPKERGPSAGRQRKQQVTESNDPSRKAKHIVVGICGTPSSGKTSLVHILFEVLSEDRDVIKLHLEDFAIPPYHIVANKDGTLDGDCKRAFNFRSFRRVLRYTKDHGSLPSSFQTILPVESDKARAMSIISKQDLKKARSMISKVSSIDARDTIVLVEGGLLFLSKSILKMLDVKLFLRTSKNESLKRRFKLPEFQKPEANQWWKTKEYFESVAWPNYLAYYKTLFRGGDLEKGTESTKCHRLGIDTQIEPDASAGTVLTWSVETIGKRLEHIQSKHEGNKERGSRSHTKVGKTLMACFRSLEKLFISKR